MLLTPAPLTAQGLRADPATIARVVDSFAVRAVAAGLTPALGVAVTMDGRTIYARSHGFVDVTAGRAADDRTLWYVASTSKSFTGFAVALLAHEGVLSLDAPITTLLPRARWHADAHPERLTLAHFLSHTHHLDGSVIVQSAAFTGSIPEARWPELLPLAPPTGSSDLVYSNFGYNVAAMVIDAKRPEGWRRYLEEHVYRPAGLRETYARVTGLEARIARPHRIRADGRYATDPFFKTDATMNSAGGHVATLGDLARWTIVQMDSGMIDGKRAFPAAAVALSHRLIAPQTRDQSKRFAYFDREGWGAGWDIGTYEGERMVSRFGTFQTTRSHLSFLPARRIGVVAASTGGAGSTLTDIVAALVYDLEAGRAEARTRAEQRLSELVVRFAGAGKSVAAQDSVRAERQKQPLARPWADFAGTYTEPSYGRFELTERDGRLEYRWGALYGPVEIFDGAKAQLRIELTGSGTVIAFTFPERGPAESVEVTSVKFVRER